ncbi:2OG-Fe(II) oxygenase family protein [Vitreimonas flagellata]|uniref:2OG-Fe(II) oxygenase family protein n=1 Tax=Vitreimonas flagellata TaxID=2560861 RepID=UPI0010754B58|nr:putative 2OG-Fe(II) oxygenase [Vitreimonas flagellata]
MTEVVPLVAELRRRRIPSVVAQDILRREQAVADRPTSAVAEHNFAAGLGDAGFWKAAEQHVRAAFAKGGDAPETWLVFARALVENGQWGEAEKAFRETLRRRPLYYDALRELAQLRWMSGDDLRGSLADIDAALGAAPADIVLQLMRAQIQDNAGEKAQARESLLMLAKHNPGDPRILTALAQITLELGEPDASLRLSETAYRLAPDSAVSAVAFASACFAVGASERALPAIERLRQSAPGNQHAIALEATAWRLLGDPRYRALYDFDAFVAAFKLGVPAGWDTLDAYLRDLSAALEALHRAKAHPFNQSIKRGTQATSILDSDAPALRALPIALDTPIQAYMQRLGAGPDPLRARNTGRHAIKGIWSIRMKSGGVHINHVHSEGWLSSACYLSLPVDAPGKEGWIKFGEPGAPTRPPCPAEHFIQPHVGSIALFPSYMWHGTIPFSGDGVRMTFALDIVPD